MKELFNSIKQKLEAEIEDNDQEENPLKRVSKNLLLIEEAIDEFIRAASIDHDFRSKESIQIEYNKNYFPPLFAKLILYRKYYDLESKKIYSTRENFRLYCEQELEKMQQFFTTHKGFCQYFHSDNTEDDWRLFTPESDDEYKLPDAEYLFPSDTNPNTLLTACLLAYEPFGKRLRQELDGRAGELTLPSKEEDVEFKGTETDVTELLMAIYASKRLMVNGKPATQEFLFGRGRTFFNVRLENPEQLIQQLKTRKGGVVKFLKVLIDGLLEWVELSSEEKRRRKKLINKKVEKTSIR